LYRKEEYKIEVLIPPNISDPLNLNAEDDSDYEAKLVSPLLKKKKVTLSPHIVNSGVLENGYRRIVGMFRNCP
jgi:hypothetical protein